MELNNTENDRRIHEVLESHEQFFIPNITIFTHPIFCGDERKPLFNDPYIHVFGGAANTAYNAEILARATQNGVQHSTFKNAVGAAAKDFNQAGIAAGVHSDTHSEQGNEIDLNSDDEIGCGYIKLRRTISQTIAENADRIVAAAESICPDLFTDPSDTAFAHDIVRAHAALAGNAKFFGDPSRKVAGAAMSEGAPTMLVEGDHTADDGIYNRHSETTIDSAAASDNDKSIYVHDAWASEALAKEYSNAKGFVGRQWQIADVIDAIGTMWALNVTTIATRE